ncbi:regulatory protein [Candidatus Endoriftia persephone str. Guaymas]|jgi:DNA-binding response OmpR family regulator|uniref:Regulatory protein for cyclic-di-GMP, EAL domain n=3 Tax=Gammaproteobacteria TaxID=1236 RepID=G2FAW1_9GAMM|nr:response regulator [Candidatus Endoriftia persephone]EGV51601.1 regulatory protein for cyclic-di-GMP, EAL domain [endosymbiont of Riftia pachyptila (vent Ph05)]EGW55899.1 regulatory protein for cyclic-di-GMP, EAL domain [endosymbiont of Tevnia jerichonana (vent Tica)]MBA1330088.1 regulatory protein [Candidatus Endoriftia persephone str. Guaymas]USF88034.1 response regulator [Candidatus Endoriftia persephone]
MDKPRLIAVDDELEMAAMIAEIAEMAGFESEVSSSAKALLDAEAECRHDVIVIDLFMPDTDGFELINALANRGCTATIIMVSGYDKTLLRGAGKIAKANGLNLLGTLTKPFRLDDVEALLRKAID